MHSAPSSSSSAAAAGSAGVSATLQVNKHLLMLVSTFSPSVAFYSFIVSLAFGMYIIRPKHSEKLAFVASFRCDTLIWLDQFVGSVE